MRKYIDADELIKTLNREGIPFNEDVNHFIIHASAADVEEVVRCKDCEYWSNSFTLNGRRRCLNTSICTDGDFYCGWGSKE